MRATVFLTSFFALAQVSSAAIEEPVHLDSGLISGIAGTNTAVRVFRGIPYAAPPVGNLRWREPQPAAHWEGVRKADQFGAMCTQPAFRGAPSANPPKSSEDCLFLNVWTAAAAANDRRPVMLWIHPGGYQTGSGSPPASTEKPWRKKASYWSPSTIGWACWDSFRTRS